MIARTNSTSPARFGRTQRPTSLVDRVLLLLTIHRERHALKTLDAHMLDDIGITRNQAETEAERPVWDAPSRWLR